MHVRKVFVFKTPFYSPQYEEFYSAEELTKFLKNFDFMAPHKQNRYSTGLPEFQLGSKVLFGINGEFVESKVQWGPRFIVGLHIWHEDKQIKALVPMDKKSVNWAGLVEREYKEVKIPIGRADVIIDLRSMYQLWPKCYRRTKTELDKFIGSVLKKRYHVRGL